MIGYIPEAISLVFHSFLGRILSIWRDGPSKLFTHLWSFILSQNSIHHQTRSSHYLSYIAEFQYAEIIQQWQNDRNLMPFFIWQGKGGDWVLGFTSFWQLSFNPWRKSVFSRWSQGMIYLSLTWVMGAEKDNYHYHSYHNYHFLNSDFFL